MSRYERARWDDLQSHWLKKAERKQWTVQRVLYPIDSELGPSHRAVHDPVVTLAYAAGHTDRIELGTATVCAA